MTHNELIKEGLNDWAAYFRRTLSSNVSHLYLSKIAPFSEKPIKLLFETVLQEREPKPSNFPSLNYIRQFLGGLEEDQNIQYDPQEDQRFPISKMWDGFRVLEKHGKDAFYNYANTVNMPLSERQCVIAKYEHCYNVNDLL